MKLTKKSEADVLKAYHKIWDAYLKGDMRTFASLLDDNCYIIGSAASEIFTNKKSAVKYYKSTAEQITGKAEFRNRKIGVMPVDKGCIVNEESDFYLLIDDQWTFYGPARISSLFHKKNNKWKVIHQHGSFPDSKTEGGEQVNTDKIKAENIQLRDAVKRRTVELENKNRELEIETALEKVRAVAMSMRKAEDLSGVGEIVFNELKGLGFADLRNTEIIIIDDTKETLTSYYYSDYGVTGVVEVLYKTNPTVKKWVKDLKKANDAFAEVVIHEKEIKAWRKYREEVGHKPDPKLNKAKEVYYYSYSIGSGGLSISTFKPANAEQIKILERFRNVFNLSYQRYIDIAQAEAQAREATIEAALERTRTQSMLMQHSKELDDTLRVFHEQVLLLGIKSEFSYLWLPDEDKDRHIFWAAWAENVATSQRGKNSSKVFKSKALNYPLDRNEPATKKCLVDWKSDEPVHSYYLPPGGEVENYFANWKELLDGVKRLKPKYFPNGLHYVEAFMKYGCFGVMIESELSEEGKKILYRFAIEFERAYTRFLDLQKAEAQTKEAQIESGLERVRSRAMAMQTSEELNELIGTVFTELTKLDFVLTRCVILIYEGNENGVRWWMANSEAPSTPMNFFVKYADLPFFNDYLKGWRNRALKWTYILEGEDKIRTDNVLFNETELSLLPDFVIAGMKANSRVYLSASFNNYGCLNLASLEPLSDEHFEILLRFAKVFDLTYTRFNDLKQAEAQAREAQIEAAMEKIRSRSLAMHKSDELKDIITVFFEKLSDLKVLLGTVAIQLFDQMSMNSFFWVGNAIQDPQMVSLPYDKQMMSEETYLKDGWQAMNKNVDIINKEYSVGQKDRFFNYVFSNNDYTQIPEDARNVLRQMQNHIICLFTEENSAVFADSWNGQFYSRESLNVIKRSAKVFNQAYIRFLDLQKSEAQTREAQIELALERVRARTMAMQKSEELAEAAQLLYEEFRTLNINTFLCGYCFYKEEQNIQTAWVTTPDGTLIPDFIDFPIVGDDVLDKRYEDWQLKKPLHILEIQGEANKEYHRFLTSKVADPIANEIFSTMPDRIIFYCANFSAGYLFIIATEFLTKGEEEVIIRFAKVFELTYTRFSDLKQAEAQAKEARIETALERIRARALAMHSSNELMDVAKVLREQLSLLGQPDLETSVIHLYEEDPDNILSWRAFRSGANTGGDITYGYIAIPKNSCEFVQEWLTNYYSNSMEYTIEISGTKQKEWYDVLFKLAPDVINAMRQNKSIHEKRYHQFSKFSGGALLMVSKQLPSEESIYLQRRAALVFELAYRRFLDLKQAEARANEARIEIALERIRARALAMHKSDELMEVAKVMREQMALLGQAELEASAVHLYEEDSDNILSWRAVTIGSDAKRELTFGHMAIPKNSCEFVREWLTKFYSDLKEYTIELSGSQQQEWYAVLFTLAPEIVISMQQKNSIQEKRYYRFSKFSGGALLMISKQEPSTEASYLQSRAAVVFDLAYRRFSDLQKAEAQARDAQIESSLERVRSKTMAMHNSQDVADTVAAVFDELVKLGIQTLRCGIGILHEGYQMEVWTAKPDETGRTELFVGHLDMKIHPLLTAGYESWKDKRDSFSYELKGDDLIAYFNAINNYSDYHANYDIATLPSHLFHNLFSFNEGVLFAFSLDQLSAESSQIFKRFAGVFGQTYRRYLDLQKAEAQAREAKIEASLERVRAKAMAMHKSEDLNAAVAVVFEELDKLDLGVLRCGIAILDEEKRTGNIWVTSIADQGSAVQVSGGESFDIHPLLQGAFDAWLKKEDFHYLLEGDDLARYYQAVKAANFQLPESQFITSETEFKKQYFFAAQHGAGNLFAVRETEFPEEAKTVMKRFASVFDLTYKRFLDLQKAEANAREAQIEAGLERVRARTMAMHSSEDVTSATETMFEEFKKLGINHLRCGIVNIHLNRTFDVFGVTNLPGGNKMSGFAFFSMDEHPVWQRWFESWKNKEEVFIAYLEGQEKEDYFRNINDHNNYLPQRIVDFPDSFFQAYYFEQGAVWTYSLSEHSESEKDIMKRFTTVFSLTFRRYQDLQKAEAQAKEAQIETGLERVRARTMAMHSSEDVSIATATMFTELEKLGIENFRGGITNILTNRTQDVWSVNNLAEGKILKAVGTFSIDAHPFWQLMFNEWQAKKDFTHYFLAGKEKEEYVRVLNANQGYLPQTIQQFPDVHFQVYYFNEGAVWTNSLQPHSEEDKQVMKKFASVFSLTFRRYQDLKKAEAQAREATIEAALEKVRGKAMAMHNSNDLSITTSMIISELRKLGIKPIRCGVGIVNKEAHKAQLYTATSSPDGDSLSVVGWALLRGHPVLEAIYEKWLAGEDYFPELSGDSRKAYYEQLLAGLSVPLPDFKDDQKHYGHFFSISVGCLYAWADVKYNDDEIKILKRFASIIDLTFRRYFELQKSEENARAAVKQAALDRIRADIASMRTISDLDRITPLIWNELTILGIPFIRCGVFIMDETQKIIHTFLSTPDGKAIAAFHLPYDTPGNFSDMLNHWYNKKTYLSHWNETDFIGIAETLVKQGAVGSKEQYLGSLPKGGFYLHFLPFLQGMLYVGNTDQLNEEQIEMIQHVADAFSTAYARYEDFNRLEAAKQQVENTLSDLKQAQQQLVQSEKMASLGELTAGIAHEIQNPLNFVNNFSDVSNELLEEMKTELQKGNNEDAIAIVEDVKQNLEKILHHGKRADAIVKGMLQHSRTSSGQKEPTDINILADEYLRLAFHGLRAKDKSFNAKFETEFDNSIGKINVIPQDIGRVILNLINNAFYAVTEKKKQASTGSAPNGYDPVVTVTTKKDNGKVEISVKDNGDGIPQKVLDKIFQPFFTTKPTGQGTGLGLSLSYDIVTKGHGGELKVETKEGEGSEFIIQLPVN